MSLSRGEIGLMKGLLGFGFSQQQLIAWFSYPWRTVHHNIVSKIARGERYGDGEEYPVASVSECLEFMCSFERSYYLDWVDRSSERFPGAPYFRFQYSYHPVGQGIFCSGFITRKGKDPYRWVFDCGTERGKSSPKNGDRVRREIAALASEQAPPGSPGTRPHLDLVALSHFDEDHLSGMIDLLRTFSVDTFLLPYLSRWDSLVVALEERASAGSDLLGFLLDPAAFLRSVEGVAIERMLMVPPTGEGRAAGPLTPPEDIDPDGTSSGFSEVVWKADPLKEYEDPNASDDDLAGELQPPYGNVEVLHPGQVITVDRAWEFVPYNDASLAGLATTKFKSDARDLAGQLLEAKTDADRKMALDGLTTIYDAQFKTPRSKKISAERRNKISLFLYSGPIGDVELEWAAQHNLRHRLYPVRCAVPVEWLTSDRFGQMFTGDGYLKTAKQWQDFEGFYKPYGRLQRAAFFQVMHHGSLANWHNGIAAKLSPCASIFCSDPAGKLGHPDEPVLMDFAPYNPKQVDAFHGWSIRGAYRFRSNA